MANTTKYCLKCKGRTIHSITFDADSDSGEPVFLEECLRCAGIEMEIDRSLPIGQQTL